MCILILPSVIDYSLSKSCFVFSANRGCKVTGKAAQPPKKEAKKCLFSDTDSSSVLGPPLNNSGMCIMIIMVKQPGHFYV